MSAPTYIYKILPSTPPPPSPLPVSLPISPLDARDQFIHCSTSQQLLQTLNRFFNEALDTSLEVSVYILRLPYHTLKEQGVVKWEFADGKQAAEAQEGAFPHLYNGLRVGREEVDRVGVWRKVGESWTAEEWPFGDEDVPV